MNGVEGTQTCQPTPLDFIEAAEVNTLPWEEQAAAFVKGTRNIYKLMDDTVCSVVMGQIGKSDIEQAIAASYFRLTLLLRGVAILEDPAHFQIANSIARTAFELVLDLKSLCCDPSLAAKFFAFARVVKFRKAEQLVSFLDANPSVDRTAHHHAISFANDPQRKQSVEQQCMQFWGTNNHGQPIWPDHWSGKNIANRAHDAGLEFEEMYRSQFFLQSQYVHAGPAGIQDLSRDALICSFGIAHRFIQQLAATATELVGNAFHLFDAHPVLREKLRRASTATAFYAVETALQMKSEAGIGSREH